MPYELEDMIARRRSVEFDFYGRTMHADYWVERMTKEFRMELIRLMRESVKLQARSKELGEIMTKVDAPLDTAESATEDAASEAVLLQFKADDERIKRLIDSALIEVLASWDLLDHGKPVPFTPDEMWRVPSEFEGTLVVAILEDARGMGEPNGKPSTKPLPIISSRRERRASGRSRRTG